MRSLPRASASPAFTPDVLRRIRADRNERPLFWRVAAVFAMAACLIAAVQLGILQQRQHARTVALRAEQQQIEADLAAVKKSASDAEPVVVLESDQGTRVIVDLDSAVQPASLRQYD